MSRQAGGRTDGRRRSALSGSARPSHRVQVLSESRDIPESFEGAYKRARAAGLPVVDFDIELDPRFRADPFERWRFAADNGPLFYSSSARGFWVVSGFDLVHEVLQRPADFSSRDLMVFTRDDLEFHDTPTQLDQPEHIAIRRLIQPLLSASAVAALEPGIADLARDLVEPLKDRDGCEFNSAFALPLTGGTIARAMGVPPELEADMVELALTVAHPERERDSHHLAGGGSRDQIAVIWNDLIAERRLRPQQDWISHVANSRLNDQLLPDQLVRQILDTLFRAGFDTTAGTLAYAFHYLAMHPKERHRVALSKQLMPAAVEEMLRCFGADVLISRTASRNIEFHGVELVAGDRLVLLLAAANRDSAAFTDAASVDLGREPNRNLAFGVGPHRCVGLHLALAELRIALREWHSAIPDYAAVSSQAMHHEISETARPDRLDLVFGRRTAPGTAP